MVKHTPTGEEIEMAQDRPDFKNFTSTEGVTPTGEKIETVGPVPDITAGMGREKSEQSKLVDARFEASLKTPRASIFDPKKRDTEVVPEKKITDPMQAGTLRESMDIINADQAVEAKLASAVPTRGVDPAEVVPVEEERTIVTVEEDLAEIRKLADERIEAIKAEPTRMSMQQSEIAEVRKQQQEETNDILYEQRMVDIKERLKAQEEADKPTFASELADAKLDRYNILRGQEVEPMAASAQVDREMSLLRSDPAKVALAKQLDYIMEADVDDLTKFASLYEVAKSSGSKDVLGDSYDVLESRYGEAKASEIRDSYLKQRGWTSEQIAENAFSDRYNDILSGEDTSIVSIGSLEALAKEANMPQASFNRYLSAISISETATPTAQYLANSLLSEQSSIAKRDIRGSIESGYLEFMDDGTIRQLTPSQRKEKRDIRGSVKEGFIEFMPSGEIRELTDAQVEGKYGVRMPEYDNSIKNMFHTDNIFRAEMSKDIFIGNLTKSVYGGNASNSDKDTIERVVENGIKANLDIEEIKDEAAGFRIYKNREEGSFFRDLMLGQKDRQLNGIISTHINRGNMKQAISETENSLLSDVDNKLQSTIFTTEVVTQADNIRKILRDTPVSKLGKIDAVTGKWKSATGLIGANEIKAQELGTAITTLMAKYRNNMLGSAVTDSEAKFLDPVVTSLKDQPETFLTKLDGFERSIINSNNAYRRQKRLPELDRYEILNEDLKRNAYTREAMSRYAEIKKYNDGMTKKVEEEIGLGSVIETPIQQWSDVTVSNSDFTIQRDDSFAQLEVTGKINSYPFAKRRAGGIQCGGYVNDVTGQAGFMGDTLASKQDGKDYVSIENGGKPQAGGYFVEDMGTKTGHTGMINSVNPFGIYITDYNSGRDANGDLLPIGQRLGNRRDNVFIPKGSLEYKSITGFGKI